MMIQLLEKEVVEVPNGLPDYYRFVNMPAFELNLMQNRYYAELHKLQDGLDDLLNELRDFLRKK